MVAATLNVAINATVPEVISQLRGDVPQTRPDRATRRRMYRILVNDLKRAKKRGERLSAKLATEGVDGPLLGSHESP